MPFTWGRNGRYLRVSAAEFPCAEIGNGIVHALDAGHWPQIAAAEEAARIMLAGGL